MELLVVKDYEEMSKKAAAIIASQVIIKPNSVLGLATGDTPLGMYKELIKRYKENEVDFSKVKTFNLDEYYGLTKDNIQSYHFYMMNNFFKFINIDSNNVNIPNGTYNDIEENCLNYERKIKESGGIDVQVLGIGVNGHIGFNEPNVNFEAQTHLVNLDEKTIKSNARFFNSIDEVPKQAISMGIKTILQSRKIILLANGEAKAEAIYNTVKGKISPEVPSSILQLHQNVTIILDESAAKLL
ncbi:glucosamine-6-phosphate deaminase [Clostridium felsineum]|uniref:Glucosamine-6-phosphate deaminase n=1 Tax=Clostridium felsineum TaxID=36839 RepID=A0A1S8MAF6_9CLOT|nr:glucosamine-6-phosphate deaminase [Clostridium felsineum]URZ08834.1 putative glucosamine-6-phosphate deaminase 2 [Clostridium felsineum]URZ09462.1 putative glucosamine-6-phosphate deaminase 2 [Clostridium felsineum]